MRVFYFTSRKYGLSNLRYRRLKVARFGDLNDPFELLGVNHAAPRRHAELRIIKEAFHSEYGVLCFSRSWRNPVLWGHYGESHLGMALGFDVPESVLAPVVYTHCPIDVSVARGKYILDHGRQVLDQLVRTKFFDWKYEEEVRLIVRLAATTKRGGLHFFPFQPMLSLRTVILGPRSELSVARVRALVGKFSSKVSVLKARMAHDRFEVIEDRSATRRP